MSGTMQVTDATGATFTVAYVGAPGAAAASASLPVSLATDQVSSRTVGAIPAINVAVVDASGNQITSFGGAGGGGSNAAAGATGAAVPTSAGYTGWSNAGTLVGASMTTALPTQPGTGSVWPSSQSGTWSVGRTWSLASGSDSVTATISGSLPAGANAIGAITNTAFGIAGTLPAFAATPTFNLGSAPTLTVSWSAQSVGVSSLPSLPAGANTIGAVNVNGTVPVSGTFWQATQPVSAAALPLPSGAATSALQPAINADGGAQVHVMNFPGTQPVSLSALPSLAAGTAVIGKVGIDQTTPGTTNGVQINAPLPAGTNTIGGVQVKGNTATIGDAYTVGAVTNVTFSSSAPGSGYAVGNTITLSGGVPVGAAWGQVTSIGPGGTITGISTYAGTVNGVTGAGAYTTNPTTPCAVGLTTGNGSGATFTPTFTSGAVSAWAITAAGSGYAVGDLVALTGGATGNSAVLTVASLGAWSGTLTTTAGSAAATLVANTSGNLVVGMTLSGNANIPGGVTVSAISGTSVTLSSGVGVTAGTGVATTGTGTNPASVSFANVAAQGQYIVSPSSGAQAATSGSGTGFTCTLTLAPISMSLFGGAAPANGWSIYSQGGTVWANDAGATATFKSVISAPYETPQNMKPPVAIQVIGAAIGTPFIARSW